MARKKQIIATTMRFRNARVTRASIIEQHSALDDDALTGLHAARHDRFVALLESDLDNFGKSMACVNIATIHDQLGQVAQALDAYDRGIAFERTFDRYNVALRKAAYCVEKERHGDALAALGALVASGISELERRTHASRRQRCAKSSSK
jgi:tetratricopeptide (TPR) repeat protein